MPHVQTASKQTVEPLDPKAGMTEMVQVVENKKRNLEKRKQKLETLKLKPEAELSEQQVEAISHIGEVNGNIQYVEEILSRLREIEAQVNKWCAIEAKKEKLAIQRNKRNAAKNNGDAAPSQDNANGTADASPRSRGSVCDSSPAVAASEQIVPANVADSCVKDPAGVNVPETISNSNDHVPQQDHNEVATTPDAAVPQDCAPDEDGSPLKETLTFVNSQANAGTDDNGQAQVDGERVHSGAGGRPYYRGPRRDYRQHDGYRGGYNHGPQSGRPPRRGGRGPYRGGPRGPPRGGPSNANFNNAPAPANT